MFSPFRAAALGLLLLPAAALAQTTATTPANNAATRTFDRAAGTDTSGAYPSQADGTAENPKGTMVSRGAHKVAVTTKHTVHKAGPTLKNNAATRTLDRAAGTDNSGAYPAQADGMPGNPKGTVVSRTLGTTNTK